MADSVRIDAPAKLNLRLRVLGRESSGFHALETVFCAVSLADEVTVRRSEGELRLVVDGATDLGPPEHNLVRRAALRYFEGIGEPARGRITLLKRIPVAGGLGGGSSDAAATLTALDALHGGRAGSESLLRWAAELGSDVPFFLCGGALALGWSRGERLLVLPPLPPRPVLIANPGVEMPTPKAFRALADARGGGWTAWPCALDAGALRSWEGVAEIAGNDFEELAGRSVPRIAQGLAEMRVRGAIVAQLAGSGSSVFGVFTSPELRDAAEAPLRHRGFTCWRAETLATPPLPRSIAG